MSVIETVSFCIVSVWFSSLFRSVSLSILTVKTEQLKTRIKHHTTRCLSSVYTVWNSSCRFQSLHYITKWIFYQIWLIYPRERRHINLRVYPLFSRVTHLIHLGRWLKKGTLKYLRTVKIKTSLCILAVCSGSSEFAYTIKEP